MFGFKKGQADRARKERIEARIEQARRPGHELTLAQKAMLSCFASIDPNHEPEYRKRFDSILEALDGAGLWQETTEWRISTWFDSRIEKTVSNGKDWYLVSVECDGQRLACGCPSPEKAFAFLTWYQRMIVDQFYAVGPPWADNAVFSR
ncbi:MAG: hypothetical protein JSR60_08970 [Proteobacteria bacterium]|nr:hypothetical protein [Pseudomonadota bacterium]